MSVALVSDPALGWAEIRNHSHEGRAPPQGSRPTAGPHPRWLGDPWVLGLECPFLAVDLVTTSDPASPAPRTTILMGIYNGFECS